MAQPRTAALPVTRNAAVPDAGLSILHVDMDAFVRREVAGLSVLTTFGAGPAVSPAVPYEETRGGNESCEAL